MMSDPSPENSPDEEDEYELEVEAPTRSPAAADAQGLTGDHYMRLAEEKLREEEANAPATPPEKSLTEGIFSFPFQVPAVSYLVLIAIGLTACSLLMAVLLFFLHAAPTVGYLTAMPVSLVTVACVGYASACYLSILQGTSAGIDRIEDWPEGDWKQWFWTLPWTLGPLLATGMVGGLVGGILPLPSWILITAAIFFLYPLVQLSILNAASLAVPFNRDVWRTLKTQFVAWQFFYLLSFGIAFCSFLPWLIASLLFNFLAVLLLGPIAALASFLYARALGRLALLLTDAGDDD